MDTWLRDTEYRQSKKLDVAATSGELKRRMEMFVGFLFSIGTASSFIIFFMSMAKSGDDKKGMVAFPFMMLLASAVARYIGL